MAATDSATVTVPREALIEAIAALEAADDVLNTLNGYEGGDDEHADPILDARWGLFAAAFGFKPHDRDDSPETVAMKARACEIEAYMLSTLDLHDRIEALRSHAARVREAGTINVVGMDPS